MLSTTSSPGTRNAGFVAVLVLFSAGLTLLLFHHTIAYGHDYDDYYFIRPWTLAQIADTFRGSWDESGIFVPFYRPLTIVWYALRFELFGIDSAALHRVSLALFAFVAVLVGLFILRACSSRLVAAFGVLAFITHPAMPHAQVIWTTNQMHLLASLIVLSALLWAQFVARRTLAWWLPLLPLAAAAFMVKEDCIMLLPVIVVLHPLRRWMVDATVPPMPRTFVALAALLVVGLVFFRQELLGGLGGYGRPGLEQAWHNYSTGLERVFWIVPVRRPWQWTASWFATLLPVGAVLVSPWASRGARFLVVAGFAVALLFNAPFVLVTKSEQMHLVALGAALVMGGSAAALVQAARHRALQVLVALALVGGFAACASLSRHISTDLAPFGPIVRSHDEIVLGWGMVPDELREYIQRKRLPGAEQTLSPNPKDELRLIGFGFHNYEPGANGTRQRWMAGATARIHIDPAVNSVVIPVRHERGAFAEPTTVTIRLNGRVVDSMMLDDGVWRYSTVVLRGQPVPWLTGMHKILVEIPHPWVPSQIVPGSGDGRTLGLQIGEPVLR